MSGYILDCCTLLNLHCGWGGLQNLHAIDGAFHVGSTVTSEVLYVRDYNNSGAIISAELSFKDISRKCQLRVLTLSSQEERALMVRLASIMDDGESEGLAIAACRGYTFCSDDGAVRKVISTEKLRVRVVSTPELLQTWAGDDPRKLALIPAAVKRITELGKFRPHRSTPYYAWWTERLAQQP